MPNPEIDETTKEFIAEYGKLVEKYKRDFIAIPQYHPDGQGGWKVLVQQIPVDTSIVSQKSPIQM